MSSSGTHVSSHEADSIIAMYYGQGEDESIAPKQARSSHSSTDSIFSLWWWEICSSFLSIICVVLVTVVLGLTNQRPLAYWTLPIQLNSVLSILTTLARATMSVPIVCYLFRLRYGCSQHCEACNVPAFTYVDHRQARLGS